MPESSRRKPIVQNRVAPEVEAAVREMAVEQRAWGQLRVANEFMKRGVSISSSGGRGVWQRHERLITAARRWRPKSRKKGRC